MITCAAAIITGSITGLPWLYKYSIFQLYAACLPALRNEKCARHQEPECVLAASADREAITVFSL